jgi:hypothetical protein
MKLFSIEIKNNQALLLYNGGITDKVNLKTLKEFGSANGKWWKFEYDGKNITVSSLFSTKIGE